MYREVEQIVAEFSSWGLRDIKQMTVRERRHWAKWARLRADA